MSLADDPLFRELTEKVAMHADLHRVMAANLEINTRATNEINTKVDTIVNGTKEIIQVFQGAKASFELLETVSKVAKVLLPIVIIVGWIALAWGSGVAAAKRLLGIA